MRNHRLESVSVSAMMILAVLLEGVFGTMPSSVNVAMISFVEGFDLSGYAYGPVPRRRRSVASSSFSVSRFQQRHNGKCSGELAVGVTSILLSLSGEEEKGRSHFKFASAVSFLYWWHSRSGALASWKSWRVCTTRSSFSWDTHTEFSFFRWSDCFGSWPYCKPRPKNSRKPSGSSRKPSKPRRNRKGCRRRSD